MFTYSIMPLFEDHVEEVCEDITRQKKEGVSDLALFSMTLVPEGNPPIEKAEIMTEKYKLFRDRLKRDNVECGILAQATIGHGYKLNNPFSFQHYVGLTTGLEANICCPYDEDFRNHMRSVFSTLAKAKPKVIMVDDDLRLMARPQKGCCCPLHVKAFNEKSGKSFTADELREYVLSHPKNDPLTAIYVQTQGEALVGAAKAMREGIDSVDPTIQGVYCCCGINAEFTDEIAIAIAGKGNETAVRINNGMYTTAGARNLTRAMLRGATQIAYLKGKVDHVLAETDTCPQLRYSTSAHTLHSHYTGTILEGASGAKHWITRLNDFEPKSGEAYRKILSKYSGFYRTLMELVPQIKPVGCCIPLNSERNYRFDIEPIYHGWSSCVLERFGLPLFFSGDHSGAVFLEADGDCRFSDSEIENMFKGTVVLAGESARRLNERGFEALTGVKVKAWEGKNLSGELIYATDRVCNAQIDSFELIPINDEVKAKSFIYHVPDGKTKKMLLPGCTVYKNPLGGTTVVFAGKPDVPFNYQNAFSFLNESRKAQFVELLKATGNLPVYYPDDAEVYMRAGYFPDGKLFVAVFNIGLDPLDELPLVVEGDVKNIQLLSPDGRFQDVKYTVDGEKVTVDTSVNILTPVILVIEQK